MFSLLFLLATVVVLAVPIGPLHAQAAGAAETETPARIIFEGVTVIDGTGAEPRAGMAIVVEGEEILAVVPVGELGDEQRDGAEVVDGSAWFAIPGLIESHTHLATMADRAQAEFLLNRMLYGGITTARDMAGDIRSLMDLQRASLVREIDAPDLHFSALMAGPRFFTDRRTVASAAGETPGEVSWMQSVTEDTDLVEAVTLARGTWATGIKTYAAIEGDLLNAIAAEARRQGIPVWSHAHVGPARALEVARTGVRAMSHVCGIGSAAIPDDLFREGQEGLLWGYFDVDLEDPVIDSVYAAMKRNGTVLDATLSLEVEADQRPLAEIDTAAARRRNELMDSLRARQGPRPTEPVDRQRLGVQASCENADAFALTRRAYEAGVMIAAGTDGKAPPDSVFPALYDEIRLLNEEAGIPMLDVLKAASLHGAVALGMEDRIGTLEPGKHANIVFLGEDPLAGAASLRSVQLTVKRGTLYYRDDFVLGELPGGPSG